jgi:hypothetical protein
MLAGSTIIMLVGIAYLARPLRFHPQPSQEAAMPVPESERRDRRLPADVDLQRNAYRTLNEDGLVDFGVGLGLSSVALYLALDRLGGVHLSGWPGLVPIFVMLICRGLRNRFVYPRIGYARLRKASPAILLVTTMTLLLVAGLVVMTLYARRGVRPPPELFPWLLRFFALAGAATLALMGRGTGFARFYVHSALLLLAAAGSLAFRNSAHGLVFMLGLPGLVLLITGVFCFFRFLRRHPKPELANGNS